MRNMTLDQICIILCRPDEERNIGSACRAMKNMGITHLRIIGDKNSYDENKVKTLALHAFDIWENAQFFSSVSEAVSDCVIAAGTTRRRGKKRKEWLVYPQEFAKQVKPIKKGSIAILFGNERTGLTDEELQDCTVGITIATSKDFPSLNLSHAVQIICYELAQSTNVQFTGYTPVSLERIHKTSKCIVDNLENIGFFKIAGKMEMQRFWKDILARAAISEGEAKYLEKIFNKTMGFFQKKDEK